MKHVVCIIHRNHLTIERDHKAIGNVWELYGEPTIQLNTERGDMCVQLTHRDCDIIWDNWNAMIELQGNKTVDMQS